MLLFPSSLHFPSFLRATRAECGRAVGGRMQWKLGLATGNSLTLATIGGGNVASIQRCQFPMVPMGNDCPEDDGTTRKRDDDVSTIRRKRDRGASDFCVRIFENRVREASDRTVTNKDTFE